MPKKAKGEQRVAIPLEDSIPQISFNLNALDSLPRHQGQEFIHFKAILSPIGLRDRGDYRRSGELDVQAQNGYIYKCAGQVTGALTSNSKASKNGDGGKIDSATGYFSCGRFYDADGEYQNGNRIYFQPGDRLYIRNKDIDMKVVGEQLADYNPDRPTQLQYPALKVEFVMDGKGKEYFCGKDYKIDKDGCLEWKAGKAPYFDTATGKGAVLSVRYLYDAHWYISRLIHEVRVSNITGEDGVRREERMPYYLEVVREYIYHNRNNGDQTKPDPKLVKEDQSRAVEKPVETAPSPKPFVKVQMSDIEEE